MESEVLKKLYYKILYNQKLIVENDLSTLLEEENKIYNYLNDKDKVTYELARVIKAQNTLQDFSSHKLYKIFTTRVSELMNSEKPDYNEIKKLIVILEILVNISPSFYQSLKEIDKEYLESNITRR